MGRYLYSYRPFLIVALALTAWVQHDPFFWDTVQLSSRQASFFYDQQFSQWLLPNQLDSGHPPVWGAWLALLWTVFGQSLPVSHWAVFPFLLGVFFFADRLGRRINGSGWTVLLLLWILLDPVFLGQAVLVSPDIALLCFFFMSLYGIFQQRRFWWMVGILGLCAISLRGMMTGFALFLFVMADHFLSRSSLRTLWAKVLMFLPGGFFGLFFLVWHYQQTGWIGYHPESPWALSFERVDMQGFFYNIAVVGWRFLDFGRIFFWLAAAICIWYFVRRRRIPRQELSRFAGLFLILAAVLIPSMLLHRGLSGHRYLLPVFIAATLLVWNALIYVRRERLRQGLAWLITLGFLTGHLWVYPDRISQQWDATLAHRPYHAHFAGVRAYVQDAGIAPADVGTVFPAIGPFTYRDLSGDVRGFKRADLSRDRYIFYSSIMNDFSDAELEELRQWKPLLEVGEWPVRSVLYKRPE